MDCAVASKPTEAAASFFAARAGVSAALFINTEYYGAVFFLFGGHPAPNCAVSTKHPDLFLLQFRETPGNEAIRAATLLVFLSPCVGVGGVK